jgi:hypothetical protein
MTLVAWGCCRGERTRRRRSDTVCISRRSEERIAGSAGLQRRQQRGILPTHGCAQPKPTSHGRAPSHMRRHPRHRAATAEPAPQRSVPMMQAARPGPGSCALRGCHWRRPAARPHLGWRWPPPRCRCHAQESRGGRGPSCGGGRGMGTQPAQWVCLPWPGDAAAAGPRCLRRARVR